MIDERGYVRPTYDELLEERIALAKELFGESIDTSNASPMGKFIRLWVDEFAKVYEDNEQVYYARFPHTATGQSLDRLMPFANITRNPATRAEHIIKFTGDVGYEVPIGFLVGTTDEVEFYLVNAVTLDENGIGQGIVQCTELGTIGNVILGSITEIINPDASISGIEHVDIERLGEDTESDTALRERFDIAVAGSGSGTGVAIRGAVMRVGGVKGCIVIENDTNETDAEGRPAHSFEVYVYGPETVYPDIAQAIFSKKPIGITSYGSTSAIATDAQGNEKAINFSPVIEVTLYIKLSVTVDSYFEINGIEQIQNSLYNFINSLKVGEDVIYTSLFGYVHRVAGVRNVPALTLSTDGATYSTGDILLNHREVATVNVVNISVEVSDYADR